MALILNRFVNTHDFYGGFEQHEVDELYEAVKTNYLSWCSGFAPLIVGGDMNSVVVQEFSRTLFNMRPDIALCTAHTIFESDLRSVLSLITVPCHIIQSSKDMAVPRFVTDYLHQNIGSNTIVEIIQAEGHLPQLSSPEVTVPTLLRHIYCDIEV